MAVDLAVAVADSVVVDLAVAVVDAGSKHKLLGFDSKEFFLFEMLDYILRYLDHSDVAGMKKI